MWCPWAGASSPGKWEQYHPSCKAIVEPCKWWYREGSWSELHSEGAQQILVASLCLNVLICEMGIIMLSSCHLVSAQSILASIIIPSKFLLLLRAEVENNWITVNYFKCFVLLEEAAVPCRMPSPPRNQSGLHLQMPFQTMIKTSVRAPQLSLRSSGEAWLWLPNGASWVLILSRCFMESDIPGLLGILEAWWIHMHLGVGRASWGRGMDGITSCWSYVSAFH